MMRANLQYGWYVLRHKWFVLLAGLKLRVPLRQLLVHDASKFSRAEWEPYVRNFYGSKPVSPSDKADFLKAWRHHWQGNPHHWEYWLDDHTKEPSEMPVVYAREMVADWAGAGRTITGRWEVREWYAKNRERIKLHTATRVFVEQLLLAI